jgi:DNA repair photolyase
MHLYKYTVTHTPAIDRRTRFATSDQSVALKTTNWKSGIPRDQPYKGRGASLNLEGRFEKWQREAFDDGWEEGQVDDDSELPPKTIVTHEHAKSIISTNDSPDIPFRYSLNPYRGCEHGCVYCFARPTHSYLGLSPGLDFETRIFAKINAPALLREELSKPGYRPDVVSLGVNTDAFQPSEREYKLTRQCLEIMSAFNQPVGLITKSALVERDIDILQDMTKRNLVHVTISITTLDHQVSRYLEPRTSAPARRMVVIKRLAEAGIPVGINVAPVIPFLTDHELETLLETAREMGAESAGYILLRLPWELKAVFRDWLLQHFPLKAAHVMSRIQDMRGAKDYDPRFGSRMTGEGIFAELLAQRFAKACQRLDLNNQGRRELQRLDLSRFAVPGRPVQGSLFA